MAQTASLARHIVPLPLQLPTFPLISNFYTPSFSPGTNIHVYSVHFVPDVDNDNRSLRGELIRSVEVQITQALGGHILSGINLFAVRESQNPVILPCTGGKSAFTLRLQYARTVSLEVAQGRKDTEQVLNIILKRAMKEMGLLQVTRLPRFYDPAEIQPLPQLNLEVWCGYTTELTLRQGIPIVNIDFSSKIVHTRSFVDELQEIRGRGQGNWVAEAKNELEGRTVIVNYGNRRCYRIDEICMNKNPMDTFDRNGAPITYMEYFRRQYNKTISDPRQPLLRCHLKKRLEEWDIYLVPELVSLTGLEDSMRSDYRTMTIINDIAIPTPPKRLDCSKDLANRLNTNKAAAKVFAEFDFHVNPIPLQVNSYNISGESVQVGGNRTLPVGPDGSFQVRDSILESIDLQNWVIMATDRDQRNADMFTSALQGKFSQMRVNFAEAKRQIYDSRSFAASVQKLTTEGTLQIVVILLPKNKRSEYEKIKFTTTTTAVVPTQVVMMPINEKRFSAIVEKVALQIQAKVGAQLWTVRPSLAFGKFLMVIGIDVFHDTKNKSKSILGFCATIHPNLNKYYSTIDVHPSGQEIGTAIGKLFTEAINVFNEKARRFPETIIVFRDGVSESQVDAVKRMEVDSVLSACQQIRVGSEVYSPNLIYTVVVKTTSARLFAPAGSTRGGGRGRGRGGRGGAATNPGEVTNPPPGTLVVDQIVPERGDFYLISHSANQGMASPSLYRTVYASHPDNFPLEELARLAYKLCHMYYNWTGAIKVPAPCMMAHKLAFLVGQCIHGDVSTKIRLSQFYL